MSGRRLQTPKSHLSKARLSHVGQAFHTATTPTESMVDKAKMRKWANWGPYWPCTLKGELTKEGAGRAFSNTWLGKNRTPPSSDLWDKLPVLSADTIPIRSN